MGLFAFRSGRIASPQIPQYLPALLRCFPLFVRQSKLLLRCSLLRRLPAFNLNSGLLPAFPSTIHRILISDSLHCTVNSHQSICECLQFISQFHRTLTRPLLYSVFKTNFWCLSNRGFVSSSCIACVKIIRGIIPLRLRLAVWFSLAYVTFRAHSIPYFHGDFHLPMGISLLPAQPPCLHTLQTSQGVFSSVDNLPNAALTFPGTYFVSSGACDLLDFRSLTCLKHPNHLISER